MAITALPTAPQRTDDPTTFVSRADAWVASLALFTTEANALQTDVNTKATTATTQAGIATTQAELATTNGAAQVALATTQANNAANSASQAAASASSAIAAPGTSATSSTSNTISTGSKTFTIQTGKSFVTGMSVKIANSSSAWLHGDITSYNSSTGELVVDIKTIFGSGSFTSWTISISAPIPEIPSGFSLFSFNNFI